MLQAKLEWLVYNSDELAAEADCEKEARHRHQEDEK
jgi:hypothetical protein